jgi:hypothetical protein
MQRTKNRLKKVPKWAWAIVICLACFACLSFAFPFFIFEYESLAERLSRRAFKSEVWMGSGWNRSEQPYAVKNVRIKMVDDLMNRNVLNGKSRRDVVGLLGEPDGDPSVRPRFPDWQMHYYLGPSRGTVLFKVLDYDYLVLRLDEQGNVITVGIVTLRT